MPCYHPLKAYKLASGGVVFSELKRHGPIIGDTEVPCGQCIGCRLQRASDWQLRIMHEASLHEDNCFVTLTYETGKLPPHGSLEHDDYQRFMKRLRKHCEKYQPLMEPRYFMIGEYGEENGRPHYHACIFNTDFKDREPGGKSSSGEIYYNSATLERIWGHGIASVQDLTTETAGYCARYCTTKVTGEAAKDYYQIIDPDTGEIINLQPEYAQMSRHPGIGANWLNKYHSDVYPHGYTIRDGNKVPPPRYYNKLTERHDPATITRLAEQRAARAETLKADNTDERLATRERVQKAKISTLKRNL